MRQKSGQKRQETKLRNKVKKKIKHKDRELTTPNISERGKNEKHSDRK